MPAQGHGRCGRAVVVGVSGAVKRAWRASGTAGEGAFGGKAGAAGGTSEARWHSQPLPVTTGTLPSLPLTTHARAKMHLAALVDDVDVALGIAVLANELCGHLAFVDGGEECGVDGVVSLAQRPVVHGEAVLVEGDRVLRRRLGRRCAHGATGDTRMDADSRDVDVDATIRVQHCHGTAPEAAIVHMRADGEIERRRAAATIGGERLGRYLRCGGHSLFGAHDDLIRHVRVHLLLDFGRRRTLEHEAREHEARENAEHLDGHLSCSHFCSKNSTLIRSVSSHSKSRVIKIVSKDII